MTAPMETDRSSGRDKSRDHGMAHRRALAVGIGASAVLHIVLVLLYSTVITQWGPTETILVVESPTRFSDDMRIVQLIELLLPELTVEPPEDDTAQERETP